MITMKEVKNKLISELEKMIVTPKAVIGISGGIDSAVVAYLTVQAKGKDNVYGVYLPSNTNTEQDEEDAKATFEFVGLPYHEISIDSIVEEYTKQTMFFGNELPKGNLKARVRMSLLYGIANTINGMVMGTGNKTEMLIGYFTKYGDGGVDIEPIADLYKTEVWDLAREIGIPEQVINKKPSAGLWEGQTDEDEIGMSYKDLDELLECIALCGKSFDRNYGKVIKMMRNAEHKNRTPPKIKLRGDEK